VRVTQMLADQLKSLWDDVEQKTLDWEEHERFKKRGLNGYIATWRDALLIDGQTDLRESSLQELVEYLGLKDTTELQAWSERANQAFANSWSGVDPNDPKAVERFYDKCELELYNLLTWHTLAEDESPLSYVAAWEFSKSFKVKSYLDFGSGVGSGGLLFGRNGCDVTLGDVSSPLLKFATWRHERRGLSVKGIDLKSEALPANQFDFMTAMDVFEHLVDPVKTAEEVCGALKPGGVLFGRFHVDADDKHFTHIVKDFKPTIQRMRELGMTEIWRDTWLWGHQAFQKAQA